MFLLLLKTALVGNILYISKTLGMAMETICPCEKEASRLKKIRFY